MDMGHVYTFVKTQLVDASDLCTLVDIGIMPKENLETNIEP